MTSLIIVSSSADDLLVRGCLRCLRSPCDGFVLACPSSRIKDRVSVATIPAYPHQLEIGLLLRRWWESVTSAFLRSPDYCLGSEREKTSGSLYVPLIVHSPSPTYASRSSGIDIIGYAKVPIHSSFIHGFPHTESRRSEN